MTIHFLVEGPSERAFLEHWAKRLLKNDEIRVHSHQGKGALPSDLNARPDPKRRGLLDQLPAKLRGFATASGSEKYLIVVLLDADDDDPIALRNKISLAAKDVATDLNVLVALAIEETEAFYLGDLHALKVAYPHADLKAATAYKPDSIVGTWELFGKVIGDGGGNKVIWAETLGPLLTIKAASSRSPSFQSLIHEILARRSAKTKTKKTSRAYRHPPQRKREKSGRRPS